MMTGFEIFLYFVVIACGLAGIAYGVLTRSQVLAMPAGNERMQEIAGAIQVGANAYLKRQYTTIGIVGVVILVILAVLLGVVPGDRLCDRSTPVRSGRLHRHERLGQGQRSDCRGGQGRPGQGAGRLVQGRSRHRDAGGGIGPLWAYPSISAS